MDETLFGKSLRMMGDRRGLSITPYLVPHHWYSEGLSGGEVSYYLLILTVAHHLPSDISISYTSNDYGMGIA